MNAIKKFEIAAFQAYSNEVSQQQRSLGLSAVSNAIDDYLGKIHARDLARLDSWQNAKACRAIAYLKLLKRDVNLLASKCRQEAIRIESQQSQSPGISAANDHLAGVKNG